MRLQIGLFAGLSCRNADLPCFGESEFELEIPEGTTVGELRTVLRIDPAIPLLMMVNNHGEREDFLLGDGFRVAMFPPIGGG
jgi:molybdopterin converting factor small subunit